MQVLSSTPKSPVDVLDYSWDFSDWLRDGDTMAGGQVTADPPDLVVDGNGEGLVLPQSITVWVRGGTRGTTYRLTCVATTNGGRTVSRTASLLVA